MIYRALLNADPVVRYIQLRGMADPAGNAAPNEQVQARKLMVRLEDRHGKEWIRQKVAAADAAEAASRRPAARPRTQPRNQGMQVTPDQQELRPQASAPPRSGWHFRFPGYHPYARGGYICGFVSRDKVRQAQESSLPQELTPEEAVLMWTYIAYGVGHEYQENVAIWAAGEPEPGATPGERRRRERRETAEEEDRAYEEWARREEAKSAETRRREREEMDEEWTRVEREERKEHARRSRLSPRLRSRSYAFDILAHSFQDGIRYAIWEPVPGTDIHKPRLTPLGQKLIDLLQRLRWDQVVVIESWMDRRELTVDRAVRTFFERGVGSGNYSAKLFTPAEKQRLVTEAAARQTRIQRGEVALGRMRLVDLIEDLTLHQQPDTTPKPKRKPKSKPRARPKSKPKRTENPLLDAYRAYRADWFSDPDLVAGYAAGRPPPER